VPKTANCRNTAPQYPAVQLLVVMGHELNWSQKQFLPLDAMHSAVLAVVRSLSVLSVHHTHVVYRSS